MHPTSSFIPGCYAQSILRRSLEFVDSGAVVDYQGKLLKGHVDGVGLLLGESW